MSWKDDKDLGPWEFEEQPNKWGYLNNPRWSSKTDAQEFSEAVGNPIDPTDTHKPCGHWHKGDNVTTVIGPAPDINIGLEYFWQPSIDVLDGKIALVSKRNDYEATDEIVSLIYENGSWVSWGKDSISMISMVPSTCRLADDYMAFYGACQGYDDGNDYSMRIYIFKEGEDPRYTDVWTCNWSTGTPFYVADGYDYNTMDCSGDRIACAGLVWEVAGVDYKYWQVKVSNDQGLTFDTTWTFPDALTATATGYWDRVFVRMSEDGIVWLLYVRAMGSTTMVELWKSNVAATSWTKIWEKDYSTDLNSLRCVNFGFDIKDTDGKDITISLYGGVASGTYYRVFYTSTDYGINFTTIVRNSKVRAMTSLMTSTGQYIVALSKRVGSIYIYERSTDYGVNFSELAASITYKGSVNYNTSSINQSYIKNNAIISNRYGVMASGVGGSRIFVAAPDPPLTGTYPDMQKYDNEIAYVECGESFSPPAPSEDYQSVIYSDDYGATWRVIQTQIQNTDLAEDTILTGTVIIETELTEPQVWPM